MTAQCQLVESLGPDGRPFAVVAVPTAGRYTAALTCSLPDSPSVQAELADRWALRLAAEPDVAQATVSVEYAAGADRAVARIAISRAYGGGSGARRKAGPGAAGWFSSQLPLWARYLVSEGAGQVRAADPADLCVLARLAYDPSIAAFLAGGRAPVPEWTDVPPAAFREPWARFEHEGAASVTWSLSPEVTSGSLPEILAWCAARPAGASAGRVSVLAAPAPAGDEPSVRQGALVTLTGPADDEWAAQATESLAARPRIALRPAYGMQAGAFIAALPLGFGGTRLIRTPRVGK
ncbi:hypothetical protein [Kitasatospora sp. KL5]|uniref:hypothetical protein n=1 Tax=Kitasatospora sp. KL5 TaxID=3425125 RepID=UPI003D6E4A11